MLIWRAKRKERTLINGTEIVKGIKQVWKQKIQNIITSINVEITKSI